VLVGPAPDPTSTGDTRAWLREELQELHIRTFEGSAGTFRPRTQLSPTQRAILAKKSIDWDCPHPPD
jgi:hypothetical protein